MLITVNILCNVGLYTVVHTVSACGMYVMTYE